MPLNFDFEASVEVWIVDRPLIFDSRNRTHAAILARGIWFLSPSNLDLCEWLLT